MSTARKILSNTIWQIIGRVSMAVLAIFTLKIATNYLSLKGYGEYAVTYEYLAFFSIIADMGLFTIAITEMSKDENKIPKIIGNILSLRTIFVVATMIAAVVSVYMIPKYDGTRIPLAVSIATLSIFFTITNGTITSVLQAKLKMHVSSIAQVVGKIAMIGYMLYATMIVFPTTTVFTDEAGATMAITSQPSDLAFYHLIIAGVVGNLIMLLVTYRSVRKITPLSFQFDKTLNKEILKKSLPYGVALILSTIYFRIDSILLSLMKNQEEVGIYAVAMRILEAVNIIPLYFMNSVLPSLTKSVADNDHEKTQKITKLSFEFLIALAFPLAVGAYVLAYPLIGTVASPEFLSRLSEGFYGSDIALQILMAALSIQFIATVFTFVLLAHDKQKKILYINLTAVIFNIIGNLAVIPAYGFRGSAVVSVLSAALILTLTAKTARKHFKYKLDLIVVIKMAISAILMGVFVHFAEPLSFSLMKNAGLIVLIPLAGIVYFALLFATKAITVDMLQMLRKKPINEDNMLIEP